MGVGISTAEFLVGASRSGVRFDRTATIGRQWLLVGPMRVGRILRQHGEWPTGLSVREFGRAFRESPGYVDPLLHLLGAREITAIDASPYEGAPIVHDLNEPVPDDLHERFSLVVDGGSLEHIFNVPVALRSYMQMVEVGGHLVLQTMANNAFGHGFFQFSPEFFYRTLSPENGYEIERVVVVEDDIAWRRVGALNVPVDVAGPEYAVIDPAEVGERVELRTKRQLLVQVLARRTARGPIFATSPQQSDYAATWDRHEDEDHREPRTPRRKHSIPWLHLARALPPEVRLAVGLDALPVLLGLARPLLLRQDARPRSLRNPRFFRRTLPPRRERRS